MTLALDTFQRRETLTRYLRSGTVPPKGGAFSKEDRYNLAGLPLVVAPQAPPVIDLLDGSRGSIDETIRFEVLDLDMNRIAVVHPATTGSVAWNPSNKITRTLSGVKLDPGEAAKLTAGKHWIRPSWVYPATGATFSLGVFLYLGGNETEVAGGTWVDCSPMPDRSYQLDQKLTSMLQLLAGTLLTDGFLAVAAARGILASDIDLASSSAVVGAPGLTYAGGVDSGLDALDNVCALLGYLPAHFTAGRRLVGRPVPNPAEERPKRKYFTYGQNSRVAADSVVTTRTTLSANVYLVRSTSPTGAAIFARYDVPSDQPNSLANVGFEIVKPLEIPGLVDDTQAYNAGAAQAKRDALTARTVRFTSTPDPSHDAWDIVEWNGERMLEVAWTLELQPGGKHTHTLAAVYTT